MLTVDQPKGEVMDEFTADGPNAGQIEYWNEDSGKRWVEMGDIIDTQIAPLGEAAMDGSHAKIVSGERILDVGCGCGQTSLELAKRVGTTGSVLGLDISAPMLGRAGERAVEAGLGNTEFIQADAQTHTFEGPAFDLAFSRFGVMFFSSPVDAFSNLLSALRPGGRLTFVAWQELGRNPWMLLPVSAAMKHLPAGDGPPDPHAPGPFAFADRDRVGGILRDSGFENITLESYEKNLLMGGGGSLDETAKFLAHLGPASRLLQGSDAELRTQVMDDIKRAIEPYHGEDGVRMGCATWIVSANRPL
ncbi:MAG TPA: class I SAM-dependent methyltransferase [Myxococcales bacterium]|nr:class I SAM-dependent methyltransferase [Myxococcales bacterium]HIK84173.1 class I SAM-dependent methyltransferase [Myxococcales bacterium]